MSLHLRQGLGLIGFGLLIGFVGFIFLTNRFGVVDELARRVSENRVNRWFGERRTPAEVRNSLGYKLGQYSAGTGFLLTGLALVVYGIVTLFVPSDG
jgi:hypothetical protein